MKEYELNNPKALNLDVLKNSDVNVTLGFKCEPELKLQLAEDAEDLGITLSSYVRYLVANNQAIIDLHLDNIKDEIENLKTKNIELIQKVSFYENEILQNLFEQHKSQTLTYKNTSGEVVNQQILKIEDAFSVLINSFKCEK